MELQEFIKQTLLQITSGVKEAQEELKDSGCLINPKSFGNANAIATGVKNKTRNIQKLKINAALTITENEGSKSGIGIAKIVKAGIDAEESSSNQQVTSIEFEIPIALPVMSNDEG